jgi:Cyclin, N-terminal domain
MLTRSSCGLPRLYNPAARYVARRKVVIDWMCEVGEEMSYQPEAIHHSVALFDAYYSNPGVEDLQRRGHIAKLIEGKTPEQVIQLISVICMLISAKFLEMTYPGVSKLNQIIQSPFTYEEFILAERHLLETFNWQLHLVTVYDIL